ncbi:MDR family MFS transporter [Melghirimyces algeriensis]|uniref:Predicted arabinose efflux permease, MFS family n=1 Tax=Melghirimyces algeriensis TaxID=910412 RepID=A0A521BF09_9BACL|nr:MFS transporter [Melghirimyces algeriensis]SMO45663.1 Predicted arabinose efflux permease, MFS family [Melghirimyces algeriensis]
MNKSEYWVISRIRDTVENARKRYHSIVWIHFWLTMSRCITGFMLYPYLVIYMTEQLGASAVAAAGAISFPPLIALFFKLWAGNISDRFGRRPVFLYSPLMRFFVLIAMVFATEVWHFYVLLVLNGLCLNLFAPAMHAQIADVVSEEKRMEAYSLNNIAINIGISVGPLLGVAVYQLNPPLIFGAEAIVALLTVWVVYLKIPETLPQSNEQTAVPAKQPVWLGLASHWPLYLLILLTVPIYMVEMQINSTLPLYLKEHFVDYLLVYGILRTVTGVLTAVLQMPITLWSKRWKSTHVIFAGYLLLVGYGLIYGFAPFFWMLVVAECCWVMSDMLLDPRLKKVVSMMAKPQVRARYFSLYDLNLSLGKMTAPVLGSVVLVSYGGQMLFGGLAALLLLTGVFQLLLISRILAVKTKQMPEASEEVG